MTWTNAFIAAVSIIFVIGFFMSMADAIDNGKSMDDFRKKYGKDLGKSLCLLYRTVTPLLWPVWGFAGLILGSVLDGLRLMTGRGPSANK